MELLKPPSFRFGLLRQNFCPWNKARRWFYKFDILGFRKCCGPSAEAMKSLSGLMKLVKLEFERCPLIHGGLVHLEGLTNLESLTIRSCKWLVNLKELQISCNDITNVGVSYLRDLDKLVVLNLEGSDVTASCLDYLTAFTSLKSLNLNRCRQTDDGCEKFSALSNLNKLNLGFNNVTDTCLGHLKGLTSLVSLNVSNSRITDDGLQHLKLLKNLHSLYLEFCGATACEIKKLQVTALQILRDTALINDILDISL